MTHEELLMAYLLKKNPDATIKDWMNALREIEEDKPISRKPLEPIKTNNPLKKAA